MAQMSVLDLFQEEIERPSNAEPEENPFRKKFGACGHHGQDADAAAAANFTGEHERKEIRIYWCWRCDNVIGCWDCFVRHNC